MRFLKIREYFQQEILRVSFISGIATFVKLGAGFVTAKIIAVQIGASGLGIIGQLSSFTNIALIVSTGAITTGTTKYISEFRKSEAQVNQIIAASAFLVALFSFSCCIILVFTSDLISTLIFDDTTHANVIKILGGTIFFFSANKFILSIINGYKKFKDYNLINVLSSILTLIYSTTLILIWGIEGALIVVVSSQSIVFFVLLLYARGKIWFNIKAMRSKFEKKQIQNLLGFSLNTLISTLALPIGQIIIRSQISDVVSASATGYWEAITRISNLYLMVVTTSLATYYLPRLSEIDNPTELKKEVLNTYKVVIPFLLTATLVIYFGRFLIIKLLFTEEFLPMSELFLFQLIGDFLKASSWVLAFLLIAKAKLTLNIILNVVFSTLLILLTIWFIDMFGVIGTTYSYFITYLVYLIVIVLIFRTLLFSKSEL